jgi:hypothetical protein
VVVLGWLAVRASGRARGGLEPAVPTPRGLVIEVLNGTARAGLARQATRVLREAGFDVVYFGTSEEKVDSTTIYVRRGEAARGHEVARSLGLGRVLVSPNPSRRVDVSVLLGSDYRLPKGRLPL